MEMYCDPEARGGVLEVEGAVNVKYRRPEILKTAHRYVRANIYGYVYRCTRV